MKERIRFYDILLPLLISQGYDSALRNPIPVAALNLLRSILPPLLTSIQRIRSRGDCERPVISRIATNA